jgi:hypothetical protein
VRVTREDQGESLSERTRAHLRTNVVGYVALFFALCGGLAWADHPGGENTISSIDIKNGEVKTQDVNLGAINSNKVEDQTLTKADLASKSVGAFEIDGNAFRKEDIAAQFTGFAKAYGIPSNAIQSNEIQNGEVKKEDLASNAGPVGRSLADSTPGPGNICNNGCTEGSLALPAGSYAISAKIWVFQLDHDEDLLHVVCELDTGTDSDTAIVRALGDSDNSGPLPTNPAHATLSMQLVHDYSSAGNVAVHCEDQDVGDARSRDLRITAIKLGSTP